MSRSEKEFVLGIRFYGVPSDDDLDEMIDWLMEFVAEHVEGIEYDIEGKIETVEYDDA